VPCPFRHVPVLRLWLPGFPGLITAQDQLIMTHSS
jgi:hypothetical protein